MIKAGHLSGRIWSRPGFADPMEFISSKDERMFVVDQTGLVKLMAADGKVQEEPFLNISDRMVKISPRYDESGLPFPECEIAFQCSRI
jgi:hypothetical protein